LSRSFFSRLSSRSFPCGCTPTHPFVNASALPDSRPSPLEDLTPSILLRPSRTAWPSQSLRRPACAAESTCHLRLALPARASSTREGPMQPSFLRMRCLFCLGVPTGLWRPVGCVCFRITARLGPGTEERVGGAGGGASSPCSPARCRRNFRTDALGRTLHIRSPRANAPLLWLTRSSCAASAAVDRPPCTARCA
jgi:hypothetical protein